MSASGTAVESDPQVDTLQTSKWCKSNAGGTAIDCSYATTDATVGGSDTQVQFNNSGALGGAAAMLYSSSGALLTVTALAGTDKPFVVKGAASQSGNLTEWQNSSGTALSYITSAGVFTGSGAGLTGLHAGNLASGTVPTERLGTGTADSSTFLRGDGTWASNTGAEPGGVAGGDLSGTYPSPTVARINGVALGSATATAGNLLIGSGTAWVSNAVSGDVTITSGGVTAIGASKVTNAMLAGSITAAKLVGTDIATVGTITSGVWNAGAVTSSGAVVGASHVATGATAPTNGMYLPAANTLGFATNSSGAVYVSSAGAMGIGTATPNAAALLDVYSTTKGFLPPRMTTTQRDAISSPATGLTVYNSSTNVLNVFNGTSWGAVGGGGALSGLSDVSLTGTASNDILRYNGSAWVNVPINAAMTTTTMFANWPDAITCDSGGTYVTLFYNTLYAAGTRLYRMTAGGTDYYIEFTSAGNYNGSTLSGSYDCVGSTLSITQLYARGQAFNFIGTGAVTTFNVGTAGAPGLAVTSDTDTGLYSSGSNSLSITAGGVEVLRGNTASSGVNYLNATAAATGAAPAIAAAGSDTNIGLDLNAKGTGSVRHTAQAAGAVALTLKAAASQTGDMLQVQNSSGTALTVVDAAGSIGIGTTSVSSKAVLDMVSTTKGFLPPRMTTTQRDAISSPATGLTLYNTTTNALNVYNGTAWGAVGGGGALSSLSDVSISGAASNDVLRYNGSAWVNVPINTAMTTTTMVANWPDAIVCSVTGSRTETYLLGEAPYTDGRYYYYMTGVSSVFVGFNSNGTYYSANGSPATSTDCVSNGWSITQLYSNGRAFNFIGTGAVTTFNVGTAGAPGLAVTSDTDTGLWSSGANTLNMSTGGSERLRVDSSGNVGIGTSSPSALLTIGSAGGSNGKIALNGSTSGSVSLQAAAAAGSTTYTLPSADGSGGQVLSTNGSGTLSWTAAGGSIPTGQVSAFALSSCPSGWSSYDPDLSPAANGTLLLLHGEGTNNSTTFTDTGPNALTMAAAGNAKISTAQYKFGSASMSFDGTSGTKISTPNKTYFSFGTAPFSIDFWMRGTSVSDGVPVAIGPDGGGIWVRIVSGKPYIYVNSAGGYGNCGSTTMSTNTWYHVAVVSAGGSLYTFIDGTLECTNAITASVSTSTGVTIGGRSEGSNAANYYFNGYIDEVRISSIPRWTAAFTAPASAYNDAPIYCSRN